MYRRTINTGEALVPDSLRFVESRNSVYATTADGRLVAIRLFDDGRVVELGSGYVNPVAVVALTDGLRLAVAEAGGAILVVRREAADRRNARLLAQADTTVLGLDEHPDSGSLFVLWENAPGTDTPFVVRYDLETGQLMDDSIDIVGTARCLVVDRERRSVVVLSVMADGSGIITDIGIDDGTAETRVTAGYDHITTCSLIPRLAVFAAQPDPATPDADVLVVWEPGGFDIEPLPFRVDGLASWGSLVLIASGTDLHAVEWGIDDGVLGVDVPLGPLAIAGYARVQVDLPALGLSVGDVVYTVSEGVDCGSTSLGVEPPNPDGTETVMLLAGSSAGEFHLEATRAIGGEVLAVRRFRVTTLWPDDVSGPPIAITGDVGKTLMNWGGTGGIAGYRFPTPGEWQVLVVLIYLKDRKFDDENATRDEWKDRVVGGGESLRRYYEEVSAFKEGSHGMTVKLVGDRVFGPVLVDRGWGEVFKSRGAVNNGWLTKEQGKQDIAGAVSILFADMANGAATIARADSFVFVIRSASDGPVPLNDGSPDLPTEFCWGHANPDVDFWRKTTGSLTPPTTPTTFTQFQRPVTFVSDRFPDGAPNSNVTRTICHEIGHNLGLADLYNVGDFSAEVSAREADAMDLMGSSQVLPHFSLANRIALGWIDPNWLRRFDFTNDPHGDSVILQSVETIGEGGPTNGRKAGIEVPINGDWSYLFEYRVIQPRQIGDQELNPEVAPAGYVICGTDLRSRGGDEARPPILRLPEDVDGDGPALYINGRDYSDSDTTNPQRMHDFVLTLDDVRSPNDDSAIVTVEYLKANRPQLLVRPAPGKGNFKSPDIDLYGPLGVVMPFVVKGAINNIIVVVHNVGSLDATNARIKVKWLPFTTTQGPWNDLDDPPPFNVPARGLTPVKVPWFIPPSVHVGDSNIEAQHFCFRVEIDRYSDPAHPDAKEIVVFDNWAQSNFDTSTVGHGSPSDRVVTAATATNTLARRATYEFKVHQDTPWYRVYLGHAWLSLAPGETRAIPLAYESLAGDPVWGDEFQRNLETILSTEHHVEVVSSVDTENIECGAPRRVFGCGLALRTGRKVIFDGIGHTDEEVFAQVRSPRDGALEPVSTGAFYYAAWPDDDPSDVTVSRQGNISDGRGSAPMKPKTLRDLRNGRPTTVIVGRPGSDDYITTVSKPAPLRP